MNAYKDRIAETERVKERKRARVGRGAGDVLVEPGNRDDEQMAVRQADASGGDIRGNQHVKNNLTSRGRQYDLSKRLRVQQRLPTHLSSGETQDRPGSVFVQKSGHVDDDVQISALDAFYEMDEDAGDLKRSELNELVEKLTCLEKSWFLGKVTRRS